MYNGRVQVHFNEQDTIIDADNFMTKRTCKDRLNSQQDQSNAYVLYWMQQSQRVEYNHALSYAIEVANKNQLPVVVFFGIAPSYPDANERHYHFMFEGLLEVKERLETLGIKIVFLEGSPEKRIVSLLKKAHTVIMDKGYLRHQREWRQSVVKRAKEQGVVACIEIESDCIVPVEITSQKEEYMARTIRPKIEKLMTQFLIPMDLPQVLIQEHCLDIESSFDLNDYQQLIDSLDIDHSVKKSTMYHGGIKACLELLDDFLEKHIYDYDQSNDPGRDITSKMSMYLHFGQISSLQIYQYVGSYLIRTGLDVDINGFLEQLIIRRELAINYVYYRPGYDRFETMTNPWAYITMGIHLQDEREVLYTPEEMVNGRTHDPYFNAAMKEMVDTGFMHGYMRMYWCKKIIEWSKDYQSAYHTALTLNNRYFIDGRDPNSYVGVAWCFGLHDQGFKERHIFGKLRYMSSNGLKSKFHMQAYIDRTSCV